MIPNHQSKAGKLDWEVRDVNDRLPAFNNHPVFSIFLEGIKLGQVWLMDE